jgi:hypothetical protein
VAVVPPQRRDQQHRKASQHHQLEGSDAQLIEADRLRSQQIEPVYAGLLDVPEVGVQNGPVLHHPRRQQELSRVAAQRRSQAQRTDDQDEG